MHLQAQSDSVSKRAIGIFSQHCLSCHYKAGPGAMNFDHTDIIFQNKSLIKYVLEQHLMPPWKADPIYKHFQNERLLSSEELSLLEQWLDYKQGKDIKLFHKTSASELGKADISIKLDPYLKKASNKDEFITYVKDLNIPEGYYLKAIQIIPSNKKIVHHCRVDLDTIDSYSTFKKQDGIIYTKDLTDNYNPMLQFVGDYVPGISPYVYPVGSGLELRGHMKVLINIHYSPSSQDELDATTVNFYFYPKGAELRPVIQSYLSSQNIFHEEKCILPNETLTLHMESDTLLKDLSLFAVQPHMHLLGKTFRLNAISQDAKDTIRLVKIDNWDFNWQENYYFNNLVKIPTGYKFVADASFDNTTNNPNNPFNPPQRIKFNGDMYTTNEMFEFYFHALEYQVGDENIYLR